VIIPNLLADNNGTQYKYQETKAWISSTGIPNLVCTPLTLNRKVKEVRLVCSRNKHSICLSLSAEIDARQYGRYIVWSGLETLR
jgi:hypothetical protein